MYSPCIAIVDDDEVMCASLADLMRSIHYRGEPFTSARTLLASADLLAFDYVVADVHMPDMGGLHLARKLREQGLTTPVILITALPTRHLDEDAIAAGAICVLTKPFAAKTLLDHIQKSLADGRARR